MTCFVAGMGTGGTISGVGRYLKEKNPAIRIIGADPVGSVFKSYFESGKMTEPRPYVVEGIGEDMIPGTAHFEFIDEILSVTERDSLNMARRISREEGILVGGSSGTATCAALKAAARMGPDDVVVVLLPDAGERYLSKLHSDDWMKEQGLLDAPGDAD